MTADNTLRLFLLRHGNTFESGQTAVQVGRRSDMALTAKGVDQARHFSAYLRDIRGINPFSIHCGNLLRQTQSGKILAEYFPSAQLHTGIVALDEIDYGAWEGKTAEAIMGQWPIEYRAWHEQAKWPEEAFKTTRDFHLGGLTNWLTKMQKTAPKGETVVAVSSNGIIRLMLNFVPGLWDRLSTERQMEAYKVKTGHFCELSVTGTEIEINAWNQSPAVILQL